MRSRDFARPGRGPGAADQRRRRDGVMRGAKGRHLKQASAGRQHANARRDRHNLDRLARVQRRQEPGKRCGQQYPPGPGGPTEKESPRLSPVPIYIYRMPWRNRLSYPRWLRPLKRLANVG
jgi:hypothetical protein